MAFIYYVIVMGAESHLKSFSGQMPKVEQKVGCSDTKNNKEIIEHHMLLALHTQYMELPRSTFQTAGKSVASHIYESRVCCL